MFLFYLCRILSCFGPVRATEQSLLIAASYCPELAARWSSLALHHTDLMGQISSCLCQIYFPASLPGAVLLRSGRMEHRDALDQAVQASRTERESEKRQKIQSSTVYLLHLSAPQPAPFASARTPQWRQRTRQRHFFWLVAPWVPGGAPFGQLSIGVKDAIVKFTLWWCSSLKWNKNVQLEAIEATNPTKPNKEVPNIATL